MCNNALNEILLNNINAKPIKNGTKISCDYCPYNSLCRFNIETDGCRTMNYNVSVSSEEGGEEDA